MKRKSLILLAVLALATFGFLLLRGTRTVARPPDRVVQGKLISVWVKQQLASDDHGSPLSSALNSAGDEAVPFLVPALETRDSALNTAWVKLWPKLPAFIKRRLDPPI